MEPLGPQQQAASLQADAERIVTVARFAHPFEAHLARARLESEGIECFVADEHMVALYSAPIALGGVRVQVRSWQQEAAHRVLASCVLETSSSTDWVSGDLDAPRCPACGSLRVVLPGRSGARRLGAWLLLGLPLLFARRRARCGHCGQRWKSQRTD